MQSTLIVSQQCSGSVWNAAQALGSLVGNTMVCSLAETPEDFSASQSVLLVASGVGPEALADIKSISAEIIARLAGQQVAVVLLGAPEQEEREQIESLVAACFSGALCIFIKTAPDGEGEFGELTAAAEKLRTLGREPAATMPRERLKAEIEGFIREHNTFALATCFSGEPRCTPVEYHYYNEAFYLITEGGKKFRGLLSNGEVSAGIYNEYTSMGAVKGLQITGAAKLVPLFSDEYCEVLNSKGINPAKIRNLPVSLYLVKIFPERYEFLNAAFRAEEYNSRQAYDI